MKEGEKRKEKTVSVSNFKSMAFWIIFTFDSKIYQTTPASIQYPPVDHDGTESKFEQKKN